MAQVNLTGVQSAVKLPIIRKGFRMFHMLCNVSNLGAMLFLATTCLGNLETPRLWVYIFI